MGKKIIAIMLSVVLIFSCSVSSVASASVSVRNASENGDTVYDELFERIFGPAAFVAMSAYVSVFGMPDVGGKTGGGGAGRRTLPYYLTSKASSTYYENPFYPPTNGSGAVSDTPIPQEQIVEYKGGNTTNFQMINQTNNQITLVRNNVTQTFNTTNITYNQTNNTYYVTDVENNYYIFEDNSTHINVTYMVDGQTGAEVYYYKLPDGRGSFDLTAKEVFGTYFIYNFRNYDEVMENENTLLLCRFDNEVKDDSAYKNSVRQTSSPSLSYTSTGAFGQGLVWDVNYHTLTSKISQPLEGDFTIEFRMYITQNSIKNSYVGTDNFLALYNNVAVNGTKNYLDLLKLQRAGSNSLDMFLVNGSNVPKKLSVGMWQTVAIVRKDGVIRGYLNGSNMGFAVNNSTKYAAPVFDITTADNGVHNSYVYLDELRISNKALYTDSYTPTSAPFDTNKVFVVPHEDVKDTTIAIMSSVPINGSRVGGVRPSMPSEGFVYVPVTQDETIDVVQQYDGSNWKEVIAAYYKKDAWYIAEGSTLSDVTITPPVDPDNPGGGSSGGSGGSGEENPDKSIFEKIIDAIIALVQTILGTIMKLLGMLLDLLTKGIELLGNLGGIITAPFSGMPAELVLLLSMAVTVAIALRIFGR